MARGESGQFPRKLTRPWPQGDGFNAFGYPVSTERMVAALDCAADDMGVHPMDADPVIREAAKRVERDDIEGAMRCLRNIVDETGVYRLLAVLCTRLRLPGALSVTARISTTYANALCVSTCMACIGTGLAR